MKCSICIATYDRPELLKNTLTSIFQQVVSLPYEVIVVDDGSPGDGTRKVCGEFPGVNYIRIEREPSYRNPAIARNVAYRAAKGTILICQSDDVIHHSPRCIDHLCSDLRPGYFLLATVINVDKQGQMVSDPKGRGYGDKLQVYVSPQRRRPLFFLGSLYRTDLYTVGGNDEEFTAPSAEDRWFALCLTQGLGLRPIYSRSIIGHHQMHPHCDPGCTELSQELLTDRTRQAHLGVVPWQASGGPWVLPSTP